MKKIPILLLVLFLFCYGGQAQATELVGPKAFGMGGAFTAVADDASSIYWNPAGLTRSGYAGGEISVGVSTNSINDIIDFASSMNTTNLLDIVNALSEEQSFNGRVSGFIGANMKNFSGGIIVNEDLHFSTTDPISYRSSEKIGNIGLGFDLTRPFLNLGRLSLGANVKIIQRDEYQYTFEDGNFVLVNEDPANSQQLGLDVGALLRVTDMVNLSVVTRNMNMTIRENDDSVLRLDVPDSVTVGAAVKLPWPLKATVAADLEHSFPTTDPVGNELEASDVLHVGFEKGLFMNALSIRGGVYGPFATSERQFRDKMTYTAGLGVNVLALHANAAVGLSDDFEEMHTTLSASFKF